MTIVYKYKSEWRRLLKCFVAIGGLKISAADKRKKKKALEKSSGATKSSRVTERQIGKGKEETGLHIKQKSVAFSAVTEILERQRHTPVFFSLFQTLGKH